MSKSDKNICDGFMNQSKVSSILPSPAMLESYEEVAPGIVDKLVNLVEKEQKHRHDLEEKSIKYKIIAAQYKEVFEKTAGALIGIFILLISFFIVRINVFAGIVCCVLCYGFMLAKRNSNSCNLKSNESITNYSKSKKLVNHNRQNLRKKVKKNL